MPDVFFCFFFSAVSFFCIIMADTYIIYSRIMLYRGAVWDYPVALGASALFFFFIGCGFSILSSMHYILSMYMYALFPIS